MGGSLGVGFSVDPECFTGGSGGWWIGVAEDRRSHPHRSQHTRKVDVLLPPGELDARRAAWSPPKLANLTPNLSLDGRTTWNWCVSGAGNSLPQHHRIARRIA
jgi:hypothetical protein